MISSLTGQAGLAARAVARFTDTLVVIVIGVIIQAPFAEEREDDEVTVDLPLWALLSIVVVWILYEAVLVAWRGQTIGKMLTRIRVVDEVSGGRVPFARAVVRIAAPLAVAIGIGVLVQVFPLVLGACYLSALVHPSHRGLPDRAAGTRVVAVDG